MVFPLAVPGARCPAERPTAVFCYNDMTAVGLLNAARRMGLTVPGDIAVAGFDDIPFATYCYPPLTTIAQPKVEMGKLAMKMALSLMTMDEEDNQEELSNIVVQGKLIVRASTVGGWKQGSQGGLKDDRTS